MTEKFKFTPELESVIASLESQRKKIATSKIQGWGAIIVGITALIVVLFLGLDLAAVVFGAIAIIPGGIILYRISDDIDEYRYRFKQEVIGAALNTINKSITFAHNQGISESEFIDSRLFATQPDRYYSEDLITGRDDKTTFYFAEVHAEYKTETRTKNGMQVHWHDILKGIVFTADFNKNFQGTTAVRPKDFGSSIGAWFSTNVFTSEDKEVVTLESDYFNENFITYSNDQIEARYILTPALMEKIAELNNRSAYCISLSFINSSVYIAFPLDHNYFEPPIFTTLLKPNLLDEDINILNFMLLIIKELDLNTRIWTKR